MDNDLISRKQLKENGTVIGMVNGQRMKVVPLSVIDNAPSVEEKSYAMGYQDGLEDGLQDMRPQGEWIKWNYKTFGGLGDWEYKCSNCEKVYGGEYNFCPNCGASMRKEGTE